ncbi:9681_t:CDS:1, partial [Scutellospora calospora]
QFHISIQRLLEVIKNPRSPGKKAPPKLYSPFNFSTTETDKPKL